MRTIYLKKRVAHQEKTPASVSGGYSKNLRILGRASIQKNQMRQPMIRLISRILDIPQVRLIRLRVGTGRLKGNFLSWMNQLNDIPQVHPTRLQVGTGRLKGRSPPWMKNHLTDILRVCLIKPRAGIEKLSLNLYIPRRYPIGNLKKRMRRSIVRKVNSIPNLRVSHPVLIHIRLQMKQIPSHLTCRCFQELHHHHWELDLLLHLQK
jgi:hypothetical protein